MANPSSHDLNSFSLDTQASFLRYLRENPSNRRVSSDERITLIEWLTNPFIRPSSQKEFSRRNYVRKTFAWDEGIKDLIAVAKNKEDRDRVVVTEDRIVDVVAFVHERNNHAGWDATWEEVSTSYHGIMRSDVIFLLKRCQICAHNPSKRPKGSRGTGADAGTIDTEPLEFLDPRAVEDETCRQTATTGDAVHVSSLKDRTTSESERPRDNEIHSRQCVQCGEIDNCSATCWDVIGDR